MIVECWSPASWPGHSGTTSPDRTIELVECWPMGWTGGMLGHVPAPTSPDRTKVVECWPSGGWLGPSSNFCSAGAWQRSRRSSPCAPKGDQMQLSYIGPDGGYPDVLVGRASGRGHAIPSGSLQRPMTSAWMDTTPRGVASCHLAKPWVPKHGWVAVGATCYRGLMREGGA